MAAHRYWRLQVDAVQSGGYVSIMELGLRTSIGGSSVATGGTASASSDGFGWVASNAFNGSTAGNGWHSGTNAFPGTTEWLQYDFGSGNDKDIVEFRVDVRTTNTEQNPSIFRLQYSDNGTDFTTLYTIIDVSAATWASNSYGMVFSANNFGSDGNAHRYWRTLITAAVGGGDQVLTEMEYRTTAGGSDVTGSGTPSVSNAFSGLTAAGVFDNDGTTYWSFFNASNWIKYDFGSGNDKNVQEVAMVAGPEPDLAPKHFRIQYSDDDSTWSTWAYLSNASWYPGERKLIQPSGFVSDSSIAAAARYWRLLVEAITSGTAEIAEMELRLSSGGADATSAGGYSGSLAASGKGGDKAFDNNTATVWQHFQGDTTPFGWFGYDFGSGNNKDIVEIALTGGATGGQSPSAFKLQRSDDGVRWASPNISLSGISSWSATQTRYFDSTGETSGAAPPSTGRPVVFICT